MKLKQIASNMTELELNNGTIVLFSYETPVAAFLPNQDSDHASYIVTEGGYIKIGQPILSKTTRKHINKWALLHDDGNNIMQSVPQSVLDNLVK